MDRVTNCLDMTIVVDWDVKPQKVQTLGEQEDPVTLNFKNVTERPENANNRAFENAFISSINFLCNRSKINSVYKKIGIIFKVCKLHPECIW